MKYTITEIDRGYGKEHKLTGKMNLTYSSDFISTIANELRELGHGAGTTISDFRFSYLLTDAPLNIIKKLIRRQL